MIKRYPRNICYRYDEPARHCTSVEDCTRKNAAIEAATASLEEAIAAQEAAQEAYDNAVELRANLNAEKQGISDCITQYDNSFNMVGNSGLTFLSEANVGCFNKGAACLQNYYNSINEALTSVGKECSQRALDLSLAKKRTAACRTSLEHANAMSCDWREVCS